MSSVILLGEFLRGEEDGLEGARNLFFWMDFLPVGERKFNGWLNECAPYKHPRSTGKTSYDLVQTGHYDKGVDFPSDAQR